VGRPAGGIILTGRDTFLIPFSILWCGFVVFWIIGVLSSGAGAFALFGLAFLCFGLFFGIGRFLADAWLRSGMIYGLTDRRILILKAKPSVDFTSMDLSRLPQAQIIERGDGRGTVRFGPPVSLFGSGRAGFAMWMPSLDPTPQFIAIPDARRVFDLVQRSGSVGS
jgi:hypothetical protein